MTLIKKKKHIPIGTLNKSLTTSIIHQAVRNSSSVALAAAKLRLADVSILSSHLGKFILDGDILNFDTFKQLTVERARIIWGDKYDETMQAPVINIDNYSGAHIHEIACSANTIRTAASKLGIRDHTLQRFLNRFIYKGKKLEFKVFKELSDKQVRRMFAERYELDIPQQRKNLTPAIALTLNNDFLETSPVVSDVLHELNISIDTDTNEIHDTHDFDALSSRFADQFSSNDSLLAYSLFSHSSNTDTDECLPLKKARYNLKS